MNDVAQSSLIAQTQADVLYIGYPKAASTFVGRFLGSHPEVTADRDLLTPLLLGPPNGIATTAVKKTSPNKIHVSIDEMVALSICGISEEKWKSYRLVPDAWDEVKDEVVLDPAVAALRLLKVHASARVLLLIREQADWLHSAYKHYMRHLPDSRRKFVDFCATPQGIVYLQAGHFDQTISAYADVFGSSRVRPLRYENINRAPERFSAELCAFLGVSERLIPQRRENESNAQVAKVRRRFPIVDRFPARVKNILKPLAAHLPNGRGVILSNREIGILRNVYATSNHRAERLIAQLSKARQE
jgi:Sulfotransferase family